MMLFLGVCILTIIVMVGFIIYTIATGQFHALPKELLITAIPSLILFVVFKLKKRSGDAPESSLNNENLNSNEPVTQAKILTELPMQYISKPLAYDYDNVGLCIIKGQEPDFNALKIGLEVQLYTEKTNQYDNKAIAVYANKTKIGYLYKSKLKDMAYDFLDSGNYVYGYISKIENNNIAMNLGYYKKVIPKFKKSTTFKLTGTAKKDIQEALMYSSEENEVNFDFNYEKDCYEVSDLNVIGYAPKSKNELIGNLSEYYAYISEICSDSDDKYSVKITINYD